MSAQLATAAFQTPPPVPGEAEDLRARVAQLERQLVRSEERGAWIHEIAAFLGEPPNPVSVSVDMMERFARVLNARSAVLWLWDDADDELPLTARVRDREGVIHELRARLGQGLIGWVAENARAANLKSAARDVRFDAAVDAPLGEGVDSLLAQPVRARDGRTIGVVSVVDKRGGYFVPDDETLLSALCATAAVVVENQRLVGALQERNADLVDAQRRLEQQLERLDLLFEVQTRVGQAEDLAEVVEAVAVGAARVIDSESVAVSIVDEGELHEWIFDADETGPGFHAATRRWDPLVRDEVMLSGESTRRDTQSSAVPAVGATAQTTCTTDCCVCAVPLLVAGRCIGVVELVNRRTEIGTATRFSRDDERLLWMVAERVSELVARVLRRRRAVSEERLSVMGSMLSGVIHDLKTPLAIASGYVQLMTRSEQPEQRTEYARRIRTQFAHIEQMTRELLAYARGEKTLLARPMRLSAFVEDVSELLAHELGEAGIDLHVDARWDGEVVIDDGKLRRVIYNLARNSREAIGRAQGAFRIAFDADGDDLLIDVSDTGPGIPEHLRTHVFDAFVSGKKGANTGLGLAIVRRFVDDQGGSVEIGDAPGGGARFLIRVPLRAG
jgi:signal transduction histidine kinase